MFVSFIALLMSTLLVLPQIAISYTAEMQYDNVIVNSTLCGMSEYGVTVRVYKISCPNIQTVTEMDRRFLKRMSAGSLAIWGSVVVFSKEGLTNSSGKQIMGRNPNKRYVVVETNTDTWDTYGHEFGHLLLRKSKLPVGDLHYSYEDCPTDENPDWEACELLDAARAWYTDLPLLDPASRYRKAFSLL